MAQALLNRLRAKVLFAVDTPRHTTASASVSRAILLDSVYLRVAGHVMFLTQMSNMSWPDEATCHIVRTTLLLMTTLRIRRGEPRVAASQLRVMVDLSIYSDTELNDLLLDLDRIATPDIMIPLMSIMWARGIGHSIHVCARIKQRAAEVILQSPSIDPSPVGDLARASALEAAAQKLLERAGQIRSNAKLGLSWTCHPDKHGKRPKIGKLAASHLPFSNFPLPDRAVSLEETENAKDTSDY